MSKKLSHLSTKLVFFFLSRARMSESSQSPSKQITKKYVNGMKVKGKVAADRLRSKGMSDEANCVYELLFLCEYFEKNTEKLTNVEKEKDVEINKLVSKNECTDKNLNALQNKFLVVEALKCELQTKLQDVQNSSGALEKERNALLKSAEDTENQLRLTYRARDVAQNNTKKLAAQLTEKNRTIEQNFLALETHKDDIKNLKNSMKKQNTEFSRLQKERDHCEEEIKLSASKMKKKDTQIMELTETVAKFKASQEMYRLQSIDLSRKLDASVSQSIVQRRDIKMMIKHRDEMEEDRQEKKTGNDRLIEDIARLEKNFHEAQKKIEQLKRTRNILKTYLERTLIKNVKLNSLLQQKSQEIAHLNNAVVSCEKFIEKLYSQVQDRQNEKDFIGTQIIRRNDEIAMLTEKLEVTQLALDRGENQYNDRLKDIRLLTIELTNLQTTADMLKRNKLKMENWSNQKAILRRELGDMKFENARLLKELQTPVNIHRWRLLSGKDPNRLEVIQKNQILQRRTLIQSAVIAGKEKLLITANHLFNSFKISLCDSKLSTMKSQSIKSRRLLNLKTKRLKSLEAECRARKVELYR